MANHFIDKPIEEELLQEEQVQSAPTMAEPTEAQGVTNRAKRRGVIPSVLAGDVLQRRQVGQLLPLLGLIIIYSIMLVSARYKVESLTKEKERLTREVEYLREHRIQMQKKYQQSIKASQVAERLKDRNIGLTAVPPYEL